MNTDNVIDLIAYANENKPVDFTTTVHDLLGAKAVNAIDQYRQEIAANMFNSGSSKELEDIDLDSFSDDELEQILNSSDDELEYEDTDDEDVDEYTDTDIGDTDDES